MICPKCGYTASASDHFCENCGNVLSPTAPGSGAAQTLICHCPPGQSQPDADGYCHVCGIRCISADVAARKHVASAADEHLAVVSDIGRRHATNEDMGAVARSSSNTAILVIADGVSSSTNAASASDVAVGAVVRGLQSAPDDADMAAAVRAAIALAQQAVRDLPFAGGDADGPETTVVVALCRGERVAVGWVGDSRAYLVGPDVEEQLTTDDSWVEEVVHEGAMLREQALADRRAHYVTQVLGMRDQQPDIHVIERDLPRDRALLLCSDGLWNYFEEPGAIAAALRQCNAKDARALCQYLVDLANERGGQDNVTVALLIDAAVPA